MFGISLGEIFICLIIASLFLKLEDIPKIVKFIKQQISYLKNFYHEIIAEFTKDDELKNLTKDINSNFTDEVKEMNSYLTKIINKNHVYNGEYDLQKIKEFYYSLSDEKPKN